MKAFVIKRGARLGAGRIKLPSGREAEPGSPVTEEDVFDWRRWSCVFSNLGGTADSMLFVLSWCFTGLGLFYWLKNKIAQYRKKASFLQESEKRRKVINDCLEE